MRARCYSVVAAAVVAGLAELFGGAACLAQSDLFTNPLAEGPSEKEQIIEKIMKPTEEEPPAEESTTSPEQTQRPIREPLPGPQVVAAVFIRGNKRQPADAIKRLLKTRMGAAYAEDVVQDDLRTLMETNQFSHVEVRSRSTPGGKVELSFLVVEYPNTSREVRYEGGKALTAEEFERLTGVRQGGAVNPAQNKLACLRIVDCYRSRGYPFARCELREGGKAEDRRVVFAITEGPRVYVREIRFEGNHFVDSRTLKRQLDSRERVLGLNLLSQPYIAAMASYGVTQLQDFYRGHGFLSARVSLREEWDADKELVTLLFTIQEGPRYRVQGPPEVTGQLSRPRQEIMRLLPERTGEYFDEQSVKADSARLKHYFARAGIMAEVQNEVVFSGLFQCKVCYKVKETLRAVVGHVFVVGKTSIPESEVLRMLQLERGMSLCCPPLGSQDGSLALAQCCDFRQENGSQMTWEILNLNSQAPEKDILVTVKESPREKR